MKIDLESIVAVIGAQTVIGILTHNWIVGACAMLGLFVGIALAHAPANLRQFTLPAIMAILWAIAGPQLFK